MQGREKQTNKQKQRKKKNASAKRLRPSVRFPS